MTGAPETAACPDDDVLAEFAEGLLAPAGVAALEAHVDVCPTCRGVLSVLGRSTHLARLARVRLLAAGTEVEAPPGDVPRASLGPASLGLREGELVADRYRIERMLGEGGMGVVVAARHVALDQPVAVKLLRPELAVDASTVQRFIREARAASRLKTPHVARVLDLGTTAGGIPFLVMELLEGKNLRQELTARVRLPEAEAAALLIQVCDALVEAHAAGIVHRDLKPENLFLVADPEHGTRIKVLDFGVSKFLDEGVVGERMASTATQAVIGSPQYMAPEQLLSSKTVDARTDLWALGVILYQLATGVLPFDGPSMPALSASILRDPPRAFGPVPPSADYRAIVSRCLAKDPDGRYPDVGALGAALRAIGPSITLLGAPPPVAPVVAPVTIPTVVEAPSRDDVGFQTGAPAAMATRIVTAVRHRRRWPVAAVALVAAATIGLVVWAASDPGTAPPVTAVAAPAAAPPTTPDAAPVKAAVEVTVDAAAPSPSRPVRPDAGRRKRRSDADLLEPR